MQKHPDMSNKAELNCKTSSCLCKYFDLIQKLIFVFVNIYAFSDSLMYLELFQQCDQEFRVSCNAQTPQLFFMEASIPP